MTLPAPFLRRRLAEGQVRVRLATSPLITGTVWPHELRSGPETFIHVTWDDAQGTTRCRVKLLEQLLD